MVRITTLDEIETAADALSTGQKQELLLFLARRLRAEGPALPGPRAFSAEQVAAWIAADETDTVGLAI